MIHLRDQDRQLICEMAAECFSFPIEIWAYGSRVREDHHDASDLDLVLRTADLSKIPPESLTVFINKLQDSKIPIIVQAQDWAVLPEMFHEQILKEKQVLYSTM